MTGTIVARWRDWSGEGLEHLILEQRPDGPRADGALLGVDDGEIFAARYRIRCDPAWQVRRVRVSLLGSDPGIDLWSDGEGRWTDGSGAVRADLAGAIDVDISATPFTNTLPIRRLGLGAGQSATILAVYVRLPGLTVTIDRQRYTCLERDRLYRYESVDSDFTRDIEVDGDGLVLTYPGLFRRVR